MRVAEFIIGPADDLPARIDAIGLALVAAERAKIQHRTVAEEDRLESRNTDRIPLVIDVKRVAVSISKGSQIEHRSIVEEGGVETSVARERRRAHDLAG